MIFKVVFVIGVYIVNIIMTQINTRLIKYIMRHLFSNKTVALSFQVFYIIVYFI